MEKLIKSKKQKRIVIGMFLLSIVLLCIIYMAKLVPFVSFGVGEITAKVETVLGKYINYNISDQEKGTLVQYHVKSEIEYGENQEEVPIQESEITLNLNAIDEIYPREVIVIPENTDVTSNYEYDENTGILVIKASNQNEYEVICDYDTYEEENTERQLNVKTSVQMSLVADDEITIRSDDLLEEQMIKNIGELTSTARATEDIYNGYMKANKINGTDYSTQYKELEKIMVSKKEAQEKIEMRENNTFVKMYQDENGENITEELENHRNLVYKSTTIEKEEIKELLGEEFTVEILDSDENIIETINQETEFEEDGTLTINYENEPENIIVRTSKVQNEGIVYLKHTKEIKGRMVDIENTKIKTTVILKGIKEEEEEEKLIWENNYETINEIKEAKTNIDFHVDNHNWTNGNQNEVIFDITLNASSIKDNMFKNPSLKIEFPKEVEKIILGESSIIYGNGLELETPYLETNENGNLMIVANLVGTQTQYQENELGLMTNVKIATTIILKKDIEVSETNVNLKYINEYEINGGIETGNREVEVSIETYKEEKIETIEEENIVYSTAETVYNDTNDIDSYSMNAEDLKVEIAPIKGDTTLKNNDIVYEGEYIKYNIKVTNISGDTINNIKVKGNIPEGTTYGELSADYYNALSYYEYEFDNSITTKEIEIGTLKAGESVNKFYEVQINDLKELTEKKITNRIQAYVGEQKISNYEFTNIVKPAEIKVFLKAELDNIRDRWNYNVYVTGTENKEGILKLKLPEAFNVTHYVYDGVKMDFEEGQISEDNIVTLTVKAKNVPEYYYSIQGKMDSSKIEKDTQSSQIVLTAVATVITDNTSYQSNENRILFSYESVSIQMDSNKEGENIKYEEEIDYEITITNTGRTNANDPAYSSVSVNVIDYLPENVKPVSMTYYDWKQEVIIIDEEGNEKHVMYEKGIESYKSTGNFYKTELITKDISTILTNTETGEKLPNIDLSFNIPYEESVTITIKATAGFVFEKTKVENTATVTGDRIDAKTSNTITHTILPFNYEITDNPDNSENPSTPNDPSSPNDPNNPNNPDNPDDIKDSNKPKELYSISGVAWFDENEDGQRQTNEKLLSGITVLLMDSEKGELVKTANTDTNGSYGFQSLEKGNYMIIFQYDTNMYSVTEYRKSGVNHNINSDVTSKTVMLQGEQTIVAITDSIALQTSETNIDMGLIKNKICDLRLDKYIQKVTVKTAKGTKQLTYNQAQLAKIEIKAKEMEGAIITVEYKIVITNEGELPATVNKVIDYMPDGLNFSPDLNRNWTLVGNGELINTSTSSHKIKEGESIELTLIATKTMTSDSTGTFTNKAEIGGMNSSSGMGDVDSTPGNKVETEDDFSKADLIISVSTGNVIIYISVIIIILVIIGILVYLGRKYGLLKISKLSLFSLILIVLVFSQYTQVCSADMTFTAGWHKRGR